MDVFTENSLHDNFALACLASYRIVENMQHAKALQFFIFYFFSIFILKLHIHVVQKKLSLFNFNHLIMLVMH